MKDLKISYYNFPHPLLIGLHRDSPMNLTMTANKGPANYKVNLKMNLVSACEFDMSNDPESGQFDVIGDSIILAIEFLQPCFDIDWHLSTALPDVTRDEQEVDFQARVPYFTAREDNSLQTISILRRKVGQVDYSSIEKFEIFTISNEEFTGLGSLDVIELAGNSAKGYVSRMGEDLILFTTATIPPDAGDGVYEYILRSQCGSNFKLSPPLFTYMELTNFDMFGVQHPFQQMVYYGDSIVAEFTAPLQCDKSIVEINITNPRKVMTEYKIDAEFEARCDGAVLYIFPRKQMFEREGGETLLVSLRARSLHGSISPIIEFEVVLQCWSDQYLATPLSCNTCPENFISNPGSPSLSFCTCDPTKTDYCGMCKANEYMDVATSCTKCPFNSASPAGSISISDCTCNPGYTGVINAKDDQCTLCAANTYEESGRCVPCPALAQSESGATSISDCVCPSGYVANWADAQIVRGTERGVLRQQKRQENACMQCAENQYATPTGCQACATGFLSPAGSSSAQDCQCGDDSCDLCLGGTYLDEAGESCLSCGEHASSPAGAIGKESCVCDLGHVFADDGSGNCEPCPQNTFALGSACVACPQGGTTAAAATASVSDCICVEGFFLYSGICVSCDRAELLVLEEVPAACDNQASSDIPCGERDSCPTGYELQEGQCMLCGEGQYKVNGACVPCPQDTISSFARSECECPSSDMRQAREGRVTQWYDNADPPCALVKSEPQLVMLLIRGYDSNCLCEDKSAFTAAFRADLATLLAQADVVEEWADHSKFYIIDATSAADGVLVRAMVWLEGDTKRGKMWKIQFASMLSQHIGDTPEGILLPNLRDTKCKAGEDTFLDSEFFSVTRFGSEMSAVNCEVDIVSDAPIYITGGEDAVVLHDISRSWMEWTAAGNMELTMQSRTWNQGEEWRLQMSNLHLPPYYNAETKTSTIPLDNAMFPVDGWYQVMFQARCASTFVASTKLHVEVTPLQIVSVSFEKPIAEIGSSDTPVLAYAHLNKMPAQQNNQLLVGKVTVQSSTGELTHTVFVESNRIEVGFAFPSGAPPASVDLTFSGILDITGSILQGKHVFRLDVQGDGSTIRRGVGGDQD